MCLLRLFDDDAFALVSALSALLLLGVPARVRDSTGLARLLSGEIVRHVASVLSLASSRVSACPLDAGEAFERRLRLAQSLWLAFVVQGKSVLVVCLIALFARLFVLI